MFSIFFVVVIVIVDQPCTFLYLLYSTGLHCCSGITFYGDVSADPRNIPTILRGHAAKICRCKRWVFSFNPCPAGTVYIFSEASFNPYSVRSRSPHLKSTNIYNACRPIT